MVCATTKARGVKEASVLNLGSLHADLPKPASQTGDPAIAQVLMHNMTVGDGSANVRAGIGAGDL